MNLLKNNGMPQRETVTSSGRRIWPWIFGVIGIVIVIVCAAGASYVWWALTTPVSIKDESGSEFTVTKGEGAKEIAKNLQRAGFIRRAELFEYYSRSTGTSGKLLAGTYLLRKDMTIQELAGYLSGPNAIPPDVTVTFPEGFTVKDMDRVLYDRSMVAKGDFTRAAGDWEGYLFPDTYRLDRHASATGIRDVMLSNFKRKFTAQMKQDAAMVFNKYSIQCTDIMDAATTPLRPSLVFDPAQNDVSGEEASCQGEAVVAMASIIEKEVRTVEDMKTVAGILWKRLSIGMPLQVDASIVYATGKKTGEITYDDLKIESLYNTYLHRGLPPGPIANPGMNALIGTVYPLESEYLYYLSKPTGETVFSRTLEEHNTAKAKFLR